MHGTWREGNDGRDGWLGQLEVILDEVGLCLGRSRDTLSQQDIAEYLCVSKGKLQAWLRGQRPSANDLERLARKLHLSPRWLLLGEGSFRDPEHGMKNSGQGVTDRDGCGERIMSLVELHGCWEDGHAARKGVEGVNGSKRCRQVLENVECPTLSLFVRLCEARGAVLANVLAGLGAWCDSCRTDGDMEDG